MGGNKERGVTKKVEGRRLKKRVATSRRRKLLKGKDIRAHIANIKQGSFVKIYFIFNFIELSTF